MYNFFEPYQGPEMPVDQPLKNQNKPEIRLSTENMEELIGYLQNDFDVVEKTSNMERFFRKSLALTGWWAFLLNKDDTTHHVNKSRKRAFPPDVQEAMNKAVATDKVLWQRLFD